MTWQGPGSFNLLSMISSGFSTRALPSWVCHYSTAIFFSIFQKIFLEKKLGEKKSFKKLNFVTFCHRLYILYKTDIYRLRAVWASLLV